jgi:hypothetical protein
MFSLLRAALVTLLGLTPVGTQAQQTPKTDYDAHAAAQPKGGEQVQQSQSKPKTEGVTYGREKLKATSVQKGQGTKPGQGGKTGDAIVVKQKNVENSKPSQKQLPQK